MLRLSLSNIRTDNLLPSLIYSCQNVHTNLTKMYFVLDIVYSQKSGSGFTYGSNAFLATNPQGQEAVKRPPVECVLSLRTRDSFNAELNFKWFLRRIRWPERRGHPFYSPVTLSCKLNSLQRPGMVPCPWQHRLGSLWIETERGI